MLYDHQLPLYVTAIYVVFHYTGLQVAQRLALPAPAEALVAGLAICLLDVPFDITGVDAGWWAWSGADRNLDVRWLGVPVTSYYWYLVFGAILAGLSRALRPWLARRRLAVHVAIAPLVGAAVIVLGTIAFLPFHGLVALGVPAGAVVAAHLGLCAGVVLVYRRHLGPAERPFRLIAGALFAWHAAVLVLLVARGGAAHPLGKALAIAAAGLGTLALTWGQLQLNGPSTSWARSAWRAWKWTT
jgi:hypothetical protein